MRSVEKQEISRTAKIIRTLMQQKQYREVIRIAEGIDLSEVNNRLMILDVTNAYEQLRDKDSAKETLLEYYRSYGITGRNMIQKLVELCFETRDVENGIRLCYKFVNEWPESSLFYLMSYHISAYEDKDIETQIMYLEKYTSMEFKERWMYELARLYANNRQKEKCAVLCHELICLYGHGIYIEKAADLKERICGLSADEVRVLEAAKVRNQEVKEEKPEEKPEEVLEPQNKEAEMHSNESEEAVQTDILILEEAEEGDTAELVETIEEEPAQEEEPVQEEESAETESVEEPQKPVSDEKESLSEEEEQRLRQISEEKVRQTEAAARERMEQEERLRQERTSKLNEAINGEDRYGQVEKIGSDQIFYPDMVKKTAPVQKKKNRRGFFDRFADNIRDTLQADNVENDEGPETDELEYMVMGINPEAYTDEIERRIIRELELLDSEEIAELTPAQIKEIYELKILHDVKEIIRGMILESESMTAENLDLFMETDPYKNDVLERIREEDEEEQKRQEESAEEESDIEEEPETVEEEEPVSTISQAAAETAAKVFENAKALVKEVKEAAGLSGESLEEEEEAESEAEKMKSVSEKRSDDNADTDDSPAAESKVAKSDVKTSAEKQEVKADVKKLKKKTRAVLASIKNPNEGMGIKEFIDCIVACADEMGYEVEKGAHITLAALAEEMLSEQIVLSLNHARRVVEHAINKQKKRSALDKFMERYGKKHGNVLRDKHFNVRVKKYE